MKTMLLLLVGLFMTSSVASADLASAKAQFSAEELMQLGEKIYQTPGQQTCLKCHRAKGEGKGWAGAAVLQEPHTWISFKTLGGYEALEADPEGFRNDMETILRYLVAQGGIKWNLNFKKQHADLYKKMDWKKAKGKRQYDIMMWGLAQPEMKKRVKAIHKELTAAGKKLTSEEMDALALETVIEYIRGFEKPNGDKPLILKKG